jgi:hypothetical protein
MAWVMRVVIDTLALNYLVIKVLPVAKSHAQRTMIVTLCTGVFMTSLVWIENYPARFVVLLLIVCSSLFVAIPFLRTFIRKPRPEGV